MSAADVSEDIPPDEVPTIYAIRVFERARRDIEAAMVRLADLEGDALAITWLDSIQNAIATLATNPRRCPLAREAPRFGREVRQLLHRRTPASSAYRVLFFVAEDQAEPPTVTIIHIRHAVRKPITIREARDLQSDT